MTDQVWLWAGFNVFVLSMLALDLGVQDGRVKPGHLLLLEAMGGGLTWGACVIRL